MFTPMPSKRIKYPDGEQAWCLMGSGLDCHDARHSMRMEETTMCVGTQQRYSLTRLGEPSACLLTPATVVFGYIFGSQGFCDTQGSGDPYLNRRFALAGLVMLRSLRPAPWIGGNKC